MLKKSPSSFTEKVYTMVAKIPRGQVLTYKEVARHAGRPAAYRAVGNIMHNNPDMKRVPCHRVVRSDGTPGGYAHGTKKKIEILRREGALKGVPSRRAGSR
jgi:methylated-DNA-[protein]-cysteine S-methyltransferase